MSGDLGSIKWWKESVKMQQSCLMSLLFVSTGWRLKALGDPAAWPHIGQVALDKTSKPIKMSSQESQNLPQKPEVKQRPPVPIKPSNNTSDTSSVEGAASQNSGNVKKIVNKFSQPEAKIPSGDTEKTTSIERRQQRPPAIKPRRKLKSSSPTSDGKAPPLPPKTRQNHSGQKDEEDSQERQEEALSAVDGSRSGMVYLLSFQDLFGLLPWKISWIFPPTIFSHQILDSCKM